jgi:hypothetical protein
MADITNEYAVDPLTGARIAVDPPLQQSETPLMGNPILTRGSVPRKGRSNTALYAGAAVAVVAILAGSAYLLAANHPKSDLMTNTQSTPPVQQEAAATPAPIPAPVAAKPAPVVAPAEAPVQPIRMARAERAPAHAVRAVRHTAPRETAPAASENSADTSVTVAPSQVATPQAAPVMAAPTASPVITPPPAP